MSNVIHPKHYNIPGRKECIEEMIDKFGFEKVEAFCELNAYKYEYRHELKGGAEDLEKAENYRNMLKEIRWRSIRRQLDDDAEALRRWRESNCGKSGT